MPNSKLFSWFDKNDMKVCFTQPICWLTPVMMCGWATLAVTCTPPNTTMFRQCCRRSGLSGTSKRDWTEKITTRLSWNPKLKPSLFHGVMQRRLSSSQTRHWCHLERASSPFCTEKLSRKVSVSKYPTTQRNTQEERRQHLQCGGSLKYQFRSYNSMSITNRIRKWIQSNP